jgi:hypothetical protein
MDFETEMLIVFLLVFVSTIFIYYMFKIAAKQREIEKIELQKYFENSK